MQDDRHDYHERDPHVDEQYEGPIKDAGVNAAGQMGIRADVKLKQSPFHYTPHVDGDLKKFQKYVDGKLNS